MKQSIRTVQVGLKNSLNLIVYICTDEGCVCVCVSCSVTSHDFRPQIPFHESNRSPDVYFHLIVSLVEHGIVLALEGSFLFDFPCILRSGVNFN